ncbi:Putative adhesin [Nonomuraea solani]|uniref:Putative adhesin n=1 Tax=Nonomuraea solani TaxID=1144553 RepID=A0A1H6D326_9ACTN|nr:Putative adhesin [Nonomuraea solani]
MVGIAGLLGLAAVLTGCGFGPTDEETKAYDVNDKVAALRVETDSGNIEVVESERQGIRVTERLMWRKNKPETSHQVQGDTLALTFRCPNTWGLGAAGTTCDVSYEVEVPKGLRVNATSDSGTLTLRNLSGDLEAQSDSGEIEAAGLAGKSVTVKNDSGSVELVFTGTPDKVRSTTDSGDISVRVPEGPYNVVAKTDSGDKNVEAATDAKATRKIELTTDSGNLEVLKP